MTKRKRPNHRPTKYTPDVVATICNAIRDGSTQHDAAALAGITKSTFHDWYNTKPDFSHQVQKAHADFKQANIRAIRASGSRPRRDANGNIIGTDGSWQANAWLLERKYPDEFGQRMTFKLDPAQMEVLQKHGLTPMEAMAQLINALDEETVDAD